MPLRVLNQSGVHRAACEQATQLSPRAYSQSLGFALHRALLRQACTDAPELKQVVSLRFRKNAPLQGHPEVTAALEIGYAVHAAAAIQAVPLILADIESFAQRRCTTHRQILDRWAYVNLPTRSSSVER